MKKVIITGATGFVGSAVVKELVENNIEVIALGNPKHQNKLVQSNLITFYDFRLEEVFAVTDVLKEEKADTFYHFAWAGSAGEARANAALQLENAKWTIECLQLAAKVGCERFVCAGSIMEIETMKAAFKAENRPGLGYIYGSGKLVAHTMCKSEAAKLGIDLVWAMITNAYGVGEMSPRLVNSTIKKCILGEKVQFTAGTQNYDFVYIDDVAKAFRLIGEKGKPFCEYLIGSSQAKPLKQFLLEMQAAVAPEADFAFGDIPYTGINQPLEDFDCSVTEKDTGFRAQISFAEGCRKTYQWWKKILEEEQNATV